MKNKETKYTEQYRSVASGLPNFVNEKDQLINFLQENNNGFTVTRMEIKEGSKIPTQTKDYVFLTNKALIQDLIIIISQLE